MEYIVVAGKYLMDDDRLNFSERVEDYIRQGRYKFEEHLAQDQDAIALFRKYISELIDIFPSNVYAYTSNNEWIIIFSQTSLEAKFKDVKGKLYIRAREERDFLEILSIKETTDVFHLDNSIVKLPEKYTYPQTIQFSNWNSIAGNWQNEYLKKTAYPLKISEYFPSSARIINAKVPLLTEAELEKCLSDFRMPLVFYFNQEISGEDVAKFINSAPLRLVNLVFFEKNSRQIEVEIQYRRECMILP